MQFQAPPTTGAMLNDFENKVIALQGLGTTIVDTVIDNAPKKSPAVRARLLSIVDGAGVDHGETLVFPDVLREMLIASGSNAVVGKLVRKTHSKKADWSYFTVEALEPGWQSKAVALFTECVERGSETQETATSGDSPF